MNISEKNNQLSNWVNKNRTLLNNYKDQWIAYNLKGIIASGKNLHVVIKEADKTDKDYVLYFISQYFDKVRFLPIRFRGIKTHEWQPEYEISLQLKSKAMKLRMIVDSGADFSLIPLKIGLELGFKLALGEPLNDAKGIGGSVKYVIRNIQFIIDNHSFTAPIAWVQDKNCTDIILGREVIFDLFDIEFLQADEKIIFRKR